MSTFDAVSTQYAKTALVQQNAAAKLMGLMDIRRTAAVLDVACGPGHITAALAQRTAGRVTGVDVSAGMIDQARMNYPAIEFRQAAVEDLDYDGIFDAAFCNSALQWFIRPEKAVKAVCRSLKRGGRMGLACPGTTAWSPFFTKVVGTVMASPEIRPLAASWRNPWFFLRSKQEYKAFFEQCGFTTVSIAIDHEVADLSVEDAYNVYLSGAGNGFTLQQYYRVPISAAYVETFNRKVKEGFAVAARDGKVSLDFNRLYYLGEKT